MLAYALGATLVIIPLATALFMFGGNTVTKAGDRIDGVIASI